MAAAAITASFLLSIPAGHAARRPAPPLESPLPASSGVVVVAASVTEPSGAGPTLGPVSVAGGGANSHGWTRPTSLLARGWDDQLRPELLAAYSLASATASPTCHLQVSLLAAIGQVESGGTGPGVIDEHHRVVPAMIGPRLDGTRFDGVPDTDRGLLDGDPFWDRAVGPMQLLPATWRAVAVDMDGDGRRDPQDVYDAAGAAMLYLCADGRDLSTAEGLRAAVLAYNHSVRYLALVLAWKASFDTAPASSDYVLPVVGPPLPTSGSAGRADAPGRTAPPVRTRPALSPSPSPTMAAGPPVVLPAPGPPLSVPPGPAPDPVAQTVPDPVAQTVPDPVAQTVPDPAAQTASDPSEAPAPQPTPASAPPVPVVAPPPVPTPLPTCPVLDASGLPLVPEPGTGAATAVPTPSDPASPDLPAADPAAVLDPCAVLPVAAPPVG